MVSGKSWLRCAIVAVALTAAAALLWRGPVALSKAQPSGPVREDLARHSVHEFATDAECAVSDDRLTYCLAEDGSLTVFDRTQSPGAALKMITLGPSAIRSDGLGRRMGVSGGDVCIPGSSDVLLVRDAADRAGLSRVALGAQVRELAACPGGFLAALRDGRLVRVPAEGPPQTLANDAYEYPAGPPACAPSLWAYQSGERRVTLLSPAEARVVASHELPAKVYGLAAFGDRAVLVSTIGQESYLLTAEGKERVPLDLGVRYLRLLGPGGTQGMVGAAVQVAAYNSALYRFELTRTEAGRWEAESVSRITLRKSWLKHLVSEGDMVTVTLPGSVYVIKMHREGGRSAPKPTPE